MTPAQRAAIPRLADALTNSPLAFAPDLLREVTALLCELAQAPDLHDPHVLHANLLRGQPAQLTREQFLHLAGEPQPQAEPVAWVMPAFFKYPNQHGYTISPAKTVDGMVPLYAHPPQQRQPLTDEQIMGALNDSGCRGRVVLTYESGPYDITEPTLAAIAFARAVEAYHGIGAKE